MVVAVEEKTGLRLHEVFGEVKEVGGNVRREVGRVPAPAPASTAMTTEKLVPVGLVVEEIPVAEIVVPKTTAKPKNVQIAPHIPIAVDSLRSASESAKSLIRSADAKAEKAEKNAESHIKAGLNELSSDISSASHKVQEVASSTAAKVEEAASSAASKVEDAVKSSASSAAAALHKTEQSVKDIVNETRAAVSDKLEEQRSTNPKMETTANGAAAEATKKTDLVKSENESKFGFVDPNLGQESTKRLV